MGILSDFFFATPADVASFDINEGTPAEHFPALQLKGIFGLNVATLDTILLGEPLDDIDAVVARVPRLVRVHDDPETGIGIERLDTGLVDRLAALEPSSYARVAARWAATDEMRGCDPAELTSVVRDLVEFVAKDRTEGFDLYLWTCL
jgi:hypothetical protein